MRQAYILCQQDGGCDNIAIVIEDATGLPHLCSNHLKRLVVEMIDKSRFVPLSGPKDHICEDCGKHYSICWYGAYRICGECKTQIETRHRK